jgi:hypothetical protein
VVIPDSRIEVELRSVSGANPEFELCCYDGVMWEANVSEADDRDREPDFFLASRGENRGDWACVRACWVRARLVGPDAREYVWVRVAPPVLGQPYGLGDADIGDVVLSPRYAGTSVSRPTEWPLPVHAYRILDPVVKEQGRFGATEVSLEAWCWLYRCRSEAEEDDEVIDS